MTLNVGRGYDGWDSIHNAADRLTDGDAVLDFGDFDPSGEDMVRNLRDRLSFFGSCPEIIKCASPLTTSADMSFRPTRPAQRF